MSKSIKLLMVLVLFAGVTACSSAETEVEPVDEVAVEEAPAEAVVEEAPVEEVVVEPTEEAPACGTFSFVVDGEFPADATAGVIDRQAIVVGVNRPDDAMFDTMTVDNGDTVQGTTYAPEADDTDVGIVAGTEYNAFMITQADNAQAFIVWSPDEPVWQDLLLLADTTVAGIGMPGPNTLMRGDTVTISVQAAEAGGIDVTLDACRGESAMADEAGDEAMADEAADEAGDEAMADEAADEMAADEDAAFACYWQNDATDTWQVMADYATEEDCVAQDSCFGGGGLSMGGCYKWSAGVPLEQ